MWETPKMKYFLLHNHTVQMLGKTYPIERCNKKLSRQIAPIPNQFYPPLFPIIPYQNVLVYLQLRLLD